MDKIQEKELIDYINKKDSKSFIERVNSSGYKYFNISDKNNLLLDTMLNFIDGEYGIISVEELAELKKILFFILDHPTFSINEKEDKRIKTKIKSLLLLTNSKERLLDFDYTEIESIDLLPISVLIGDNKLLQSILNKIIKIPYIKEEILNNEEYIYNIGEKIIQGNNREGINILNQAFEGKIVINPYDMYALSIKYVNIEVFNEITPFFNKSSVQIDEEAILDLIFTAIVNKQKDKNIINALFKTIPVENFLKNGIKKEKNQKKVLNFYHSIKNDDKKNKFVDIANYLNLYLINS